MQRLSCDERDRLFEQYSLAVETYQRIILRLDEASSSKIVMLERTLNEADSRKQEVDRFRQNYEQHCIQHGCEGEYSYGEQQGFVSL